MKKLHERAEWWHVWWIRCARLHKLGSVRRDYRKIADYCHKRYLIVLNQIKDAQ